MSKRGQRGLGVASLSLIDAAAAIAAEYGPISVRGICYKLFVQGRIPSMEKKETQRVGRLLVYAREHGIIDWADIVDETRQFERPAMWHNLTDFGAAVARSYRKDFWTAQDCNVQVWSEKSTVGGILRPVTEEYGVPFLSVHGFGSATSLYDTAIASADDPRRMIILYCGDHDPSGRHMSDVDIPERLKRYGGSATIRRIALIDQDLPGLPSFPAKPTDPRYKWFRSHFGALAWELDALDPDVLRARVEDTIRQYIDWTAWERMKLVEAAELTTVREVAHAMGR